VEISVHGRDVTVNWWTFKRELDIQAASGVFEILVVEADETDWRMSM